jgi:hypothetical protein
MRRHQQPVDLLVGVVGEREHHPVRPRPGSRIAAITASQGIRPERDESPDADQFVITLDPGTTVTFGDRGDARAAEVGPDHARADEAEMRRHQQPVDLLVGVSSSPSTPAPPSPSWPSCARRTCRRSTSGTRTPTARTDALARGDRGDARAAEVGPDHARADEAEMRRHQQPVARTASCAASP